MIGTKLSYNEDDSLSAKGRKVGVSGQAYFDVRHKNDLPFLVKCNGLTINVLGTKFDVSNYPETGIIQVVLESGKIVLTNDSLKVFNYTLHPGEMAEYNTARKTINITTPDLNKYISWKDGMLVFKNDPLKLVLEKLEKWYNIDIQVKDTAVYQSVFTGTIKHESYEQILRLIEFSCSVNCRIINNTETGSVPEVILSKK